MHHELPDLPSGTPGLGDVLPSQFRVALGHLDVRVTEDPLNRTCKVNLLWVKNLYR